MIKKLIVTGAAAGLLLVSVTGAFASTTVSNVAGVHNTSVNVANTGLNLATGHRSSVRTGNAVAFQATYNAVDTSATRGRGTTSVGNSGGVNNLSVNVANSGVNGVTHGGSVHTGGAFAGQDVTNVVNTSVSN